MSVPPHPPSWIPPWQPTGAQVPGGPTVPPPGQRPRTAADRSLVIVLVALASFLVGAVGAGVVAMLVFVSGAAEIGRGFGEEVTQGEDPLPPRGETTFAPLDQFPAAEPGDLGSDPALDALAAECFDGDLNACDTLYFRSPPLSDYEEYALTCGGRVKAWVVVSCTELD